MTATLAAPPARATGRACSIWTAASSSSLLSSMGLLRLVCSQAGAARRASARPALAARTGCTIPGCSHAAFRRRSRPGVSGCGLRTLTAATTPVAPARPPGLRPAGETGGVSIFLKRFRRGLTVHGKTPSAGHTRLHTKAAAGAPQHRHGVCFTCSSFSSSSCQPAGASRGRRSHGAEASASRCFGRGRVRDVPHGAKDARPAPLRPPLPVRRLRRRLCERHRMGARRPAPMPHVPRARQGRSQSVGLTTA